MVPLNTLKTKSGCDDLIVDGLVSFEGIIFPDSIWIQTARGNQKSVYYRLTTASHEYKRFHLAFLWVADLAKHFVDFLLEHAAVQLADFRGKFHAWLIEVHAESAEFQNWINYLPVTDFRTSIVAHIEYLWKEALDIITPESELKSHPIWAEFLCKAVPLQQHKHSSDTKTVVTPFVYDCFKNLSFGSFLDVRQIENAVALAAESTKSMLGFASDPSASIDVPAMLPPDNIKAGDVVGLPRDENSAWKAETNFAFVQEICEDAEGTYLKLLWMYRPEETTCGNMKYPYPNELFMSDHCECGNIPYRTSEVIGKLLVEWIPRAIPTSTYFVRQQYQPEDKSFVTFRFDNISCRCKKIELGGVPARQLYKRNGTVLAAQGQGELKRLEPFIIVKFSKSRVRVRQLLRAGEHLQSALCPPNELLWTDKFLDLDAKDLHRRCNIRFLQRDEKVPNLYNRGGQADCFYITRRLVGKQAPPIVEYLNLPFPTDMAVGFDPDAKLEKAPLAMLSLFSGGGNFDRGLEEGGAVSTKWAVEWNQEAVHTYHANCRSQDDTAIFHGSVDECLARAMKGLFSDHVPRVGEVDAVAAGNPCQGFSSMNRDRESKSSRLNVSKVASVASYVDFYRPGYVLLENVVAMAADRDIKEGQPEAEVATSEDKKTVGVYKQLVCALVGMGYQLQTFKIGAWATGDPQSRRRIFIAATAPCLAPMSRPHLTHSDPPKSKKSNLKKPIAGREKTSYTPSFKFVSAAEATRDLPDIGDGQVHVQPGDARSGAGLHWDQDRFLTIMEARRAQGFPDYEPIIGSVTAQWKIVGNSVARSVSLALGMSLREAWLSHPLDLNERFMSTPDVKSVNRSGTVSQEEAPVGPMVVIPVRHVEQLKDVALHEHVEAAESDLYTNVLPGRSTIDLSRRTGSSLARVRTDPIVVIPRKTNQPLGQSERRKGVGSHIARSLRHPKRKVATDRDSKLSDGHSRSRRDRSRFERGCEARYEGDGQSSRISGLSSKAAIVIQDSDSDEERIQAGAPFLQTRIRAPRLTPPLESTSPSTPGDGARSHRLAPESRSRRAKFVVPEIDGGQNESEAESITAETNRSDSFAASQHSPAFNSIDTSEELGPNASGSCREQDVNASGQPHNKSSNPSNETRPVPTSPAVIPEFEMIDVPSEDVSEDEEEHESMFVPFRMFSAQTPSMIVLDSDSDGEDMSLDGEAPFRGQAQRQVASSTKARVYIDLDDLDD
ncbi:hypothetical protein FKW77_002298 [Venturia effusa]|uniref:DNA (cytosine-5-)-methyltransferase n=1 Tax=Venturia effusa TaxID=50376 RepID=A0A517LQV9_9PEZI|nr:hypothetical protein FKW77_002298 [Venturia effusa]